jgi:hypothetical protein
MSNIILFDEEQNIVEIQYEGVNAQLLAELDVRLTDLEQQTATDYFLLNAELNALQATVNQLVVLVQQNYDDIQQEIEDRENADNDLNESFANEIILTQQLAADAIQLEAETRAAAIIAEAEARGTAIDTLETELNTDISAIAMTVSGLAASVGGNTAAIILANEAIALETETRAAQYSAILADFGDTNAAVLEESVVRADADEAFASQLTIVEADVDGAYAAVSAEAIARASGDSANASSITALGVQVGNNTTAIVTEASARVAADGSIESKYGVKIDVNGNVAGFGLISQANNGAVVSTFNFRSDTFNIFNGSTPVAPFSVSGGTVFLDNLVVRSIVRQGQTAFDTGTGFWLGNDGGTPRFSIGNSSANKLTWNGSTLSVTGAINMTNSVQSWTPTWTGFLSPPSGTISYLDLGAIVFLWVSASRTGSSNATTMTITNLPASIRPVSGNRFIPCHVVDDGGVLLGAVNIDSSGLMTFYVDAVIGGKVGPSISSFGAALTKGIGQGWTVVYAKN